MNYNINIRTFVGSIGARRVKRQCSQFQEYCNAKNIEGCRNIFQEVKQEYDTLKTKLETYFQLLQRNATIENI
ncbi:hypothetical protein H5410_058420 [Solanum commersonii]|uniref:Histidine-containing phosphotransfer protein n=1 Tax=Solanum commersonii TaxID=4109 RepID=A0A9J5WTK8_SOLCO|nr:hypothetical protein H5410_058420 [Solanum commersonii]